jgi:hypothetical protein
VSKKNRLHKENNKSRPRLVAPSVCSRCGASEGTLLTRKVVVTFCEHDQRVNPCRKTQSTLEVSSPDTSS